MTIIADQLTKRYGCKYAIQDVASKIQSGAVIGFLGTNGAGRKSATKR